MSEEIPLIYTSRGNLPLADLTVEAQWFLDPQYVKLVERYRAADGEVVRESAHVYSLLGVAGEGVASSF
jgi:hypothetical protein